jgi:hypothetical protein
MPERFLRGYYLATPLFILLDLFWAINVRATGLAPYPAAKWMYYVFCLGCATLLLKRPQWSLLTGFVESAVSLIVLFVGFVSPYFRMLATAVETTPIDNPYSVQAVVNFGLSAAMLLIAFYSSIPRLVRKG